MNFNMGSIGKIVQMANMVKNPQQAINMLLDNFGKKNPQMAKTIRQAINSGKNPKQFIMEQAKSGKITMENLNQLKQYYGMAQKLGLAKNVPNNVWQEAENAIKSGVSNGVSTNAVGTQNSSNNRFNGF